MKKVLFVSAIALVLAACSKDKFQTVPQVTIESITPDQVFNRGIIQMVASVTDKEGDLQDSVLVVRKKYNGAILLTNDTTRVSIKGLGSPQKDKLELRITISYGQQYPEYAIFQGLEYDFDREFTVGLVVKDNAGNRSEYAESKRITLKKF